jgi:hypothetical protein
MAYWNDVWRIVNGEHTSVRRTGENTTVISDTTFRPLPLRRQERVNDIIDNEQKKNMTRVMGKLDTLGDLKQRSAALVPLMLNNYKTSRPLTATVQDAIMNMPTMQGVPGQDPATRSLSVPNIYISPQEAASVYSQKGIPELIIRKKSQSILLNGVKIKNPRLSAEQLDVIQEDMVRNGLANHIANAVRDGLAYGGSLLYPMFKKDNPMTMHLPVAALVKYGVVGKGCIDWFVSLDRWNTVHIPNWNPTARDFMSPRRYYIPFLGCDVSGERCARIVTAPQVGYWGTLMTLGWGISDIPGWIESVYNYYSVMSAIPTMISQMSILARTFNVDGVLATEGANILEDIITENTIKVREMSPNNPINLDVIGDIQAIQRNFKEVPNLVRLIRQDTAGRAGIPEELLWSSERGAFSSGDTTDSALERQQESIKYTHKDVEYQLRPVAQLEVINALGLDREVLRALPYTTIEFSNIMLANVKEKAEVAEKVTKGFFDLVAGGMPLDSAAQTMETFSDEEFSVGSKLMRDLIKRQKENDDRSKEKHDKEMELLDAQIEQTHEQTEHIGDAPQGMSGGTGSKAKPKAGGKEGYTPLEQKRHERTRGAEARREGLSKAESKKQ